MASSSEWECTEGQVACWVQHNGLFGLLGRCIFSLGPTTAGRAVYVCSGVCAMVGPGWVQHNGLIGFLGRSSSYSYNVMFGKDVAQLRSFR